MLQQSTNLITEGILVSNLHYGVFVRNWWVQKSIKNSNNQILPIPYRLYMRVTCKLNGELFILSVVQSITNPLQPGFICTCKEKSTEIMTSASAAINTLYQEIFGRKTEYSGPIIMGFYNNNIVKKLVKDVIFFPLFISIESFSVVITNNGLHYHNSELMSIIAHWYDWYQIYVHSWLFLEPGEAKTTIDSHYASSFSVVITSIGYSDNSEFNGAGNGFSSSIITKFQGKQSIILQQIKNNVCTFGIYQESKIIAQYQGETPNNVWKKTGINKKFEGNDLFGIMYPVVQSILQQFPNDLRICTLNDWLFLEPGEAKTTIDSHYASITHAIKRYIRIGYDIKESQDIHQELYRDILQQSKIIAQYQGETPNNVWKKTGINKKFEGNDLFGIMYPVVQSILQQFPNDLRICTLNEWNNSDFLQQAFDQHIKSRKIITSILLDWKKLFDDWLLQKSTIIQIPKMLQKIYPIDYQLQDKEIRAWKAMFKACGCNNVTPFEKDISNIEFWSRALDSSGDQETLINLYNTGFALKNNKRGIDGKIRVLSIIADKFRYQDLREKLQVGSTSINSARKHARLNGPGASPISKPQRTIRDGKNGDENM
ncbi:hypothetical protein Glove_115g68 [Diversispora epigaea]|uniref:Uncharacterized protein n=1 Tax=Diversispora epigaea TaxID=1348612 RepID=A0A397J133_9GLOM|nr:hypothetical protein Glove_115g68 [Diversispora epigaea]